jgi:hypothetical protein
MHAHLARLRLRYSGDRCLDTGHKWVMTNRGIGLFDIIAIT